MKRKITIATFLLIALCTQRSSADKIYLMNGGNYNNAEAQLIGVMTAIGHTVVVQTTILNTLPAGFTSVCNNPATGYDWLCFFGDVDYSGLLPQVQAFIDAGGKVFYQYEVSCCTNSSSGVATLLSGLTGLSITPNNNSSIAGSSAGNLPGWDNISISSCITMIGNAYKGLDGLPSPKQFTATNTLNGAMPSVTTCLNFGFHFETTDFIGTANNGAITGLGDYNTWMNGGEPFSNAGTRPIDTSLVKYFFPVSIEGCYLFPPGCMLENTSGTSELNNKKNNIEIFPNPVSSTFKISGITLQSSIQILDMTGKVLMDRIVNDDESIDMSDFAKGVYILKSGLATKMILKI